MPLHELKQILILLQERFTPITHDSIWSSENALHGCFIAERWCLSLNGNARAHRSGLKKKTPAFWYESSFTVLNHDQTDHNSKFYGMGGTLVHDNSSMIKLITTENPMGWVGHWCMTTVA